MNNYLELISVPGIAIVVYAIIEVLKYTFNNSEKFKRLIPITAVVLGAILGISCYYLIPNIVPTDNILMALLIGSASGLSATGTNRIFKQLNK